MSALNMDQLRAHL